MATTCGVVGKERLLAGVSEAAARGAVSIKQLLTVAEAAGRGCSNEGLAAGVHFAASTRCNQRLIATSGEGHH